MENTKIICSCCGQYCLAVTKEGIMGGETIAVSHCCGASIRYEEDSSQDCYHPNFRGSTGATSDYSQDQFQKSIDFEKLVEDGVVGTPRNGGKVINECLCGYQHLETENKPLYHSIDENTSPFINFDMMTNFGSIEFLVCPKCGTIKTREGGRLK